MCVCVRALEICEHKDYVKDTGDFLEKIKSLNRIPEDAFLYSKTISLNLTQKSNNKSLVLPLGANLHHHMHVSSWIKWRLIFWKRKL